MRIMLIGVLALASCLTINTSDQAPKNQLHPISSISPTRRSSTSVTETPQDTIARLSQTLASEKQAKEKAEQALREQKAKHKELVTLCKSLKSTVCQISAELGTLSADNLILRSRYPEAATWLRITCAFVNDENIGMLENIEPFLAQLDAEAAKLPEPRTANRVTSDSKLE